MKPQMRTTVRAKMKMNVATKKSTFNTATVITTRSIVGMALVAIIAGCSTIERSRSLGDPAVSAKTIALQVCSNCHGVDGNATSPNFPNLAGQREAYTVAQLSGFKSHNRIDPAGFEYMWGLSKHLSNEQINGLATYFASQIPTPGAAGAPSVLSEGKQLFENGVSAKNIPACTSCHGDQGQGNAAFPRLASQHADYLVKQLVVFQRTDERPEGAIMKQIAHDLTADNMQAVAAYLQALPGK